MALPDSVFGQPFGGPSVYLDTSQSEVVDATAGQPSLFIPGDDFVVEASYERLGPDLLLSGEERSVFVKGTSRTNRHRIFIRPMEVRLFGDR